MNYEPANDVAYPQDTNLLQYVGDNTDHNISTIGGKNTHHGLSSIP